MSTTAETQPADPTGPMVAFWTQCFEHWNHLAATALTATLAATDPQQMQQRWLEALAQASDEYLRSPVFLESMKRHLKATTDMKVLQDQLVQGAARQVGSPLANDITGLYERLHSHEHTILTRLKAIESRLKAIEARLPTSSAGNGASNNR